MPTLAFRETVDAAGTAQRIAAAGTEAELIEICAKKGTTANTGVVYVGGSDVDSTNGRTLAAGETCLMYPPGRDCGNVYIDAANNDDGVEVLIMRI